MIEFGGFLGSGRSLFWFESDHVSGNRLHRSLVLPSPSRLHCLYTAIHFMVLTKHGTSLLKGSSEMMVSEYKLECPKFCKGKLGLMGLIGDTPRFCLNATPIYHIFQDVPGIFSIYTTISRGNCSAVLRHGLSLYCHAFGHGLLVCCHTSLWSFACLVAPLCPDAVSTSLLLLSTTHNHHITTSPLWPP